jgi:hypothetical protein
MTDRDTFAAAALTGLVGGRYDATATVASRAYNLADAMLRERLRNGAVSGCETVTLTDAEREAVERAVRWMEPYPQCADTLRSLLARLA